MNEVLLTGHVQPHADPAQPEQMSLVAFSGELDRLFALLTIATSAATMGVRVRVFFTFWATAALRRSASTAPRSWFARVFGWMLPKGADGLKLSKLPFMGLGTALLKRRMAAKNVPNLRELLAMAGELGVEFRVCETSMDLLGISIDELIDYPHLEQCGVSTFVNEALNSKSVMLV